MKIGIFDSGIGGITVLYEALKVSPNESYIYYADSLNAPYGTKPKDEVKKYIFDAVDFIVKQDVQAVVIACNTATSVAIDELRSMYDIPIIGMEPAVKPAVENNKDKRVLVTATPLTIKEEKLKNLIDRIDNEHIVDLLPLPKLVEFAENFEFREEEVLPYLQTEFQRFDMDKYGTIVLGCTHFPLYKDMIRKLVNVDTDIIDGNAGTVKNLKKKLEGKQYVSEEKNNVIYYKSGIKVEDDFILEKYKEILARLDRINK